MTTPTPQDYALEPCPFCGGPAELDACDRLITIGCKACGYSRAFNGLLQTKKSPVRVSPLEFYHQHAEEEAIAAWNRRAPLSGWISVDERLPPCDGETMFIGENEAGYVACFNRFTEDGYCFHDSAESEICVMSGLRVWKRVDLPPPPSTKGAE